MIAASKASNQRLQAQVAGVGPRQLKTMTTLKLGLPKGSLQGFHRAALRPRGIHDLREHAIVAPVDRRSRNRVHAHPRPGDGAYVADGVLDCGLTGQDWIAEHQSGLPSPAPLVPVADLPYSKQSFGKVQWVLAAPEVAIKKPQDLEAPRSPPSWCVPRISDRLGVNVNVEFSWGATK